MPDDTTETVEQVTTLGGIAIPSGTAAGPDPIYDPSLSLLSVPTTTADVLGDRLGVLQFPAVAAGRLSETPIADTLRRLDACAEAALHSFATGTSDAPATARRLVAARQRTRTLLTPFQPALRTAVEWWVQPVLKDTAFVDSYATEYAAENRSLEAEAVRAACDDLRQAVDGKHPSGGLAGVLDGTAQTHSRTVAAVVARLALAPDLPREDLLQADHGAFEVDIVDRARAFADAADRVDTDSTSDGTEALTRRIAEATDQRAVGVTDELVGSPPLLAAPRTATETERSLPTADRLTGYPTGTAWLLTKAFTEGSVGTAVYPVGESQLNSLTNPWVTDDSTAPYRRRFARGLATDNVLASLFAYREESSSEPGAPSCPLCRIAIGDCDADSCLQSTLLNGVRSDYEQLQAAVRAHDDGDATR
ncbi:hypothetical protein [Haloarcula sediminis]|uniref:hypothetical protein n=1 Tax=Haloarcula sediminis TaxID=3111777 RepID=UPI002D77E85D|nr:hypothetical protein [Haloarcula sp. CK38]